MPKALTGVEIDLGAGPVVVDAAHDRLDLVTGDPVAVPTDGPVRWEALDQLGQCSSITWSGADRGLSAALAAHPVVSDLTWRNPPAEIDLTETALTSLYVEGPDLRRLRLPRSLGSLRLHGTSEMDVVAADSGQRIRLTLWSTTSYAVVPDGLDGVRAADLIGPGELSAAPLSRLPELEELYLRWSSGPGHLSDAETLTDLHRLRHLYLFDAYELTAHTLPDLPNVYLQIDGLRKSVAASLKTRYRDTPERLSVFGAKADAWLLANIDNPLRDWVDGNERGGAAACKAYASAVRAIERASAGTTADDPGRIERVERALKTMVEKLNDIDEEYGMIDTIRREEASDAFYDLAEEAGVPDETAEAWLDEWQDF